MRLRFGDHSFDPEKRELSRGGTPVPLSPRAGALLAVLLESRPDPVARELLRRTLWPEGPAPEGGLATLVLELRGAIEERGGRETIRKTALPEGYAFVADASEDRRPLVPGVGFRFRLLWDDREIALDEGDNIIGRDYGVQVRVDDAKVSRLHAKLTVEADRVTLEDLGSRNGTFHNEKKLERAAELADGDRITIGRVRLVFRAIAPAIPSTR